MVKVQGGICDHEAGIAQGTDQDDECVHIMCVFNPAASTTAYSHSAGGPLPLDIVTLQVMP